MFGSDLEHIAGLDYYTFGLQKNNRNALFRY